MLLYILVAGSIALSLASGLGLAGTAGVFRDGLLARGTLELLAIVTMIEMLTVLLEATGSLRRMLAGLRTLIDDARVLIAIVPSVLGLFPIPGGAILSAPMVGKYGDELGMGTDDKSALNLFFRHIFDQVFPFKPHLILAATVLNLPLFTLIGWQLPVSIAAALVGYWYMVGRKPRAPATPDVAPAPDERSRSMWVDSAPFLIPLILGIVLRVDFTYAMGAGVLFAIATQGNSALLKKMVSKGLRFRMLFILAAVMIFKTAVERSGVVGGLAEILSGYGVPPALLVGVLPMILGIATGLEVAVVAIGYPLLVGLIPAGEPMIPYILVMMVSNAVGATLSPAHLCMAAGNEYFKASLAGVIRWNLFPQGFRYLATVAFALAVGAWWRG